MSAVLLDKKRVRASFARAARHYDRAAVLQRHVADELVLRLEVVRLVPRTILEVGCGTGYATRLLARRYRRANIVALDLAVEMAALARARNRRRPWRWFDAATRFAGGDAEALPLASLSVDLIVSNLTLQWCRPAVVFAEFRRVLRPGGLLVFTSFGPDTLRELRSAWQAVDGPAGAHVHEFVDMHDLGDELVRAGFADPVLDVEHMVLTYPEVRGVLRDLKQIGAHNAAQSRARGLTAKGRFARFEQAYEGQRRDGRIPATYEVVYGHAWAPEPTAARADREATIPLAAIRRR
jgi:malonyl-CoA O-methyltransferase